MAQTMSMGQAAGLAAVQSLQKEQSACQLDVTALRNKLARAGAILELPRMRAFTGRNEWKKNGTTGDPVSLAELLKNLS
jgi:hypothetical protein